MRLPPKDQLIIGLNTLREVLLHAPHRLLCIFAPEKKKHSELLQLAEKKNIPIQFVSEDLLTRMAGTDSHQSFAAHVKGRNFLNLEQFVEKAPEECLVLMLDQIFDPQNFGALLRSAECFGAAAVAWSKNRGSDLTPTATKASSGASELIPLIRISNLAEAVSQFQKHDFEVVAAVANPQSESLFQFTFSPRTVLVVGSEGEGIQPLIQRKANRSLYIPMAGKIESLNVAQATSVLLSFFRRSWPGEGKARPPMP